MTDLPDIQAKGVHIQVVAVKLPNEWILRGIGAFKSVEEVTSWLTPFVLMAARPADHFEWSQHRYNLPHYLVYGSGTMVGSGWPETGVWVFHRVGSHDEPHANYSKAAKLRDSSL